MPTLGLVEDFFAQDPTDRSRGEERCAKRFIGSEGVGNFENAVCGALAIHFRYFVFFYAPVELPCRGIDCQAAPRISEPATITSAR